MTVREIISKQGYQADSASTGILTVEKAKKNRFVVFDIEARAGNGVYLDPLVVPETLKGYLNRFNGKALL